MVAKRRSSLRQLHALMRAGAVRKQYLALVRGQWQHGEIAIDAPLTVSREGAGARVRVDPRGKPALSRFRLVRHYGTMASLLEVEIATGRTHQIRVHALSAGHPVAGDERYGDEDFNAACAALGLKRMFLHAQLIEFVWPESGVELCVSAPLPEALREFLDALQES
jgi:23S rRNA pseudouridine955/2504/2580 synthase